MKQFWAIRTYAGRSKYEVDHQQQCRVCLSKQTFISGEDQPDDCPVQRLEPSKYS